MQKSEPTSDGAAQIIIPNGYEFVGWYEGGVLLGTSDSYTVTNPIENRNIVVKFGKTPTGGGNEGGNEGGENPPTPTLYTVTLRAEGGECEFRGAGKTRLLFHGGLVYFSCQKLMIRRIQP